MQPCLVTDKIFTNCNNVQYDIVAKHVYVFSKVYVNLSLFPELSMPVYINIKEAAATEKNTHF